MRKRKERGATLVEAGLVLPILILLAIGLSEIGFLVVDFLTVTNAAREGARTGAAAADYVDSGLGIDADDLILEAVEQAACNLTFGDLIEVEIYLSDADGGQLDPATGVNVYEPGVSGLDCSNAGNGLNCTNGCPWSVTGRDRTPPVLDNIGVNVTFSHTGVTGIFPFPAVNWDENAVMQIEPDTRG
ncbi:MAG: TadE/TadG family type IV pilus assembly protein [Acidimicrobiia bacterium]